ncbi:helix-turn-helix domain-containing protein [Cryptosporangium aurantiacum]|uniref:Transcriptional regulator, AraC family n=1 Tax=Cryptosporangium aurantiacum TaxID=134849 RepID=A0A1M7M9D5_9ACTN|nr:helix-turn-helix domain-containing protein [Cryptosporangium aurantiacum]SHM86890.1 transcriptional regulator, AraC family [Cryptosporangium aurantiacum]
MARVFTTDAVAARERLEYWNAVVSDAYVPLRCRTPDNNVTGSIRVDSLATLELSLVTSTPQNVVRSPSLIARSAEDYFLVNIQTEGTGLVSQDGRTVELRPGDFALYDSTRPYELGFPGAFQQYVLMLPGPALRSQLGDPTRRTARGVRGAQGAGHLLIEMIRTLAADITVLEPAAAVAVARGVEHLVVAGLSALAGDARPEPSAATRREQVMACARARLRDPGLTVASIAAELHTSVSTLHRAFAGESYSIAEWIWVQRLERVRAELLDPAQRHRTISDLAFGWGFVDASHFSRAFRQRYGCTARELRV